MTRPLAALFLTAALAAGLAPEPDDVRAEAAALAKMAAHYQWHLAGHSGHGRPIGLLVATARPADLAAQFRILVFARQHGDETSPAAAALLWLRSNAAEPTRFRRVAVLLVPTLNPDGAATGRRSNGAGVDLNRDWQALSQPETQLADALVRRWQPHLVVDLHEFDGLQQGRRHEEDWIEMLRTGRPAQDQTAGWLLHEVVAAQQRVGEPVRALVVEPGSTAMTLAHRALALRHRVPALLVEVGDRRADPAARVLDQLVALASARYDVLKPRVDALRGSRDWHPPAGVLATSSESVTASPPSGPAPAGPPPTPPWPAALALAAILLSTAKFRVDPDDRS